MSTEAGESGSPDFDSGGVRSDSGLSASDPVHALVEPLGKSVLCSHPGGLHRLHYWEWSPKLAPRAVVLCVHGLTRSGRDFDVLASSLVTQGFRVVAPDMPGRGQSEHLDDAQHYNTAQYLSDCITLIARLDVPSLHWIGTSMGGLIGMTLAAVPGHPIERLVLNDIGPEVPAAGLERIADTLGAPRFESFEAGEAHLREQWQSFGSHSDAEFRLMSRYYLVDYGEFWSYHYDPVIGDAFRDMLTGEALSIWPVYDAIDIPMLVLRGAESDVLETGVASRLSDRGPRAEVVTLPDVGHAPTLMSREQRAPVERFLTSGR